jgi:hydroxypyruvate isomerase
VQSDAVVHSFGTGAQMPRFAANLTMLYTDSPVIQRFERAKAAGFEAVELLFPYDEDLDAIEDVLDRTGLELILFNLPVGNFASGGRGMANDPTRVEEFKSGVARAVEIAGKLGVGRVNCLVGKTLPDVDRDLQMETVRVNLDYAASEMSKAKVLQVFEPLNPHDNPGFLITMPSQGFTLQAEINHANLKVEYDIYHAQRTEGDLVRTINEHIGAIGHVQLADNPGRNEPGTGEINYPFVLQALDDAGYDGWVGLEYRPKTTTDESLGWLKNYGYWN